MDIIDQPTETQWREALADPAATFFHTSGWSRLMEDAFPGSVEACPAGFKFPDGAIAVLPLMRLLKLRGLARSLHSMFPGVYGGPVCARPLNGEERFAINEWLAGREGMRTFCLAPPGVANPVPAGARQVPMATQRLALRPDLELMESDILSHGKKYSVKRAIREGVEVERVDSLDLWRDHFRAYVESRQRWRGALAHQYPRRLFEAMGETGSENVSLWVASVGGKFAAGAVILSFNRHIVTWHEASFAEYHRMGVNDYLHLRIIEEAARGGFPHFDFNPSGGHSGVEKYKASFGAEKVPLEAWMREPAWVRGGKRLRSVLRRGR
jgi:hypothetical protein